MSGSAPRPAFLVLLGVIGVLAIFMFMKRGGNDDTTASTQPAAATATPTQAAPAPGAPGAVAPVAPGAVAPGTATAPAAPQTSAPAAATRPSPSGRDRDLPAPVARAIADHKVVAVLFWNRRGVDDRAVHRAFASISSHGGRVRTFVDRPKHAYRYSKITSVADIDHTPAMLVVNRRKEAKVVSGFLDSGTVQQQVLDALHGD
jgi:hypothetical protein